MPRRFPLRVYYLGWMQALIQLCVFGVTGWQLVSESRAVVVFFWAIPFGWSWFALLMVGHDAAHRTFSPWKSVDRVVAFLTLDCLLVSERCWRYEHQLMHHAHPRGHADTMHLRGNSLAAEIWNLLRTVVGYMHMDLIHLATRPSIRDVIGTLIRYALLVSMLPFALFPALLFLIISGNYLGLLSHAVPVEKSHEDALVRQLRTTWDFFPQSSFLAGLITGGLNAHATHHVAPHLPRGAHASGARVLKEVAQSEYRSIDSFADLLRLFRSRHGRPVKDAPSFPGRSSPRPAS